MNYVKNTTILLLAALTTTGCIADDTDSDGQHSSGTKTSSSATEPNPPTNMEYKVKSKKLQTHYEKSLKLIEQIEDIEIHHIRREFNSRADQLANEALDEI